MNTIRPELMLTEWKMTSDDKGGDIQIGVVQNIGQGPAAFIRPYLDVIGRDQDPNCAFVVTKPISILPRGAARRIDWTGHFSWRGGTVLDRNATLVPLRLILYYQDLNNNTHMYALNLAASSTGQNVANTEPLGPGLSWSFACVDVRGRRWWHSILPLSPKTCPPWLLPRPA